MLRRLPFYVEYVFTKYLKTQILKTLVHGTFLVENVFFAFLLRYDDPNQLLYLGYDYVRRNVVIYTDNMTLSVPCCVVCVIIIVSLSSPQVWDNFVGYFVREYALLFNFAIILLIS